MCHHHGLEVVPERFMGAKQEDIVGSVLRLMSEVGLNGKLLKNRQWKDLTALGSAYPVMVEQKSGHWIIVASVTPTPEGDKNLAVMDPRTEQAGLSLISRAQFEADWTGTIVLSKRDYDMEDGSKRFGLRWFMPAILKHKTFFRDIIVTSTMINLISFIPPLSFQIMLDRVIPFHSYQTLYTMAGILVLATLFGGLFTYLQTMLTVHASNRIDRRLIVNSFAHLLHLPMPFFEETSTGVTIRHMQQTEGIRGFLTGRLFHVFLDSTALPFLLVILFMYSSVLTLIVISFTVVMAGLIGILIPTFRQKIETLYNAESSRQADLVETVHGMRAVKSMALEPLRKAAWRRKVAHCLSLRTSVGRIGALAGVAIGGLQGGMKLTLLSLGILEVFNGHLSVGELVAFNMFSGRVTGPLVSMVALINDYQQTLLSVKMLGHVMDHPLERDPNHRGIRPAITGKIEFNNVTFRYDKTVTPALNKISFKVEEGQMIGVVGRSGSGKTTLTRLIQGIHAAQEGLILLNGDDIRHFELPHLRRSIGVVLQDNILFRGSIRENIAAGRPEASLEEVIEAAQMAGAAEFIERLPKGYDTYVEEGATNFSGGQRQRLSISRVLLLRPRLLIFDEATSALDPESEAIIRKSLAQISAGRTMIIVSHRLASLVTTDSIMVLDRGEVVDFAPHTVLLERCDIYRHLWEQQQVF